MARASEQPRDEPPDLGGPSARRVTEPAWSHWWILEWHGHSLGCATSTIPEAALRRRPSELTKVASSETARAT